MMYWSSGKNSTGVLHCVLEFEMGAVATLTVVWVAIGVNMEIGSKLVVLLTMLGLYFLGFG